MIVFVAWKSSLNYSVLLFSSECDAFVKIPGLRGIKYVHVCTYVCETCSKVRMLQILRLKCGYRKKQKYICQYLLELLLPRDGKMFRNFLRRKWLWFLTSLYLKIFQDILRKIFSANDRTNTTWKRFVKSNFLDFKLVKLHVLKDHQIKSILFENVLHKEFKEELLDKRRRNLCPLISVKENGSQSI